MASQASQSKFEISPVSTGTQKIGKSMCFPCSFPYKPVASVAVGIFFGDQKNGSGTSKFDDKRPMTLW